MPSPVKLSCCTCGPTAGVGGLFDAGSWGDFFGSVLKTGVETGAKFGIQYGLAELTGNTGNRTGTPIGYAQPAPPTMAVQPVQYLQPAQTQAPASNLNTTVMLGAAAVLIAVVLTR